MQDIAAYQNISIRNIFFRFKWKILVTLLLVLLDSLLHLLFPLFIGYAINGLLENRYDELIYLGCLGISVLVIGSGRRFYDTRAYAEIYKTISVEVVSHEHQKESSVSTISARVSLLTEFIEFFENSVPAIVTNFIGVFGILLIVFTLNIHIFWACLAVFLMIVIVYVVTGDWHFRFNENYNNQLEKQVDILSSKDTDLIKNHFGSVMKWNIKLSDLETANFSVIWLGLLGLLVYAPVAVIQSGIEDFGLAFSVLMYVFDYIENVVYFPFYIQQVIRLQEISSRLRN